MVRSGSIVGRLAEMAMLEEHLAAARSGRGGLVLLAGEPGIGKTRLAREVADRARRSGMAAVWGRCREDGGAPPYFPWVQVLRGAIDVSGSSLVDLGPAWAEVESLVGPVSAPSGRPVEPSQRFRLFAAVTSMLGRCARGGGLLAIVDDLHRADEGSLALLSYLAPDLADFRLLVLAAYRDSEVDGDRRLADTIGRIADGGTLPVVRLKGLDDAGVAALIDHHVGPVAAGVAEMVADRTGGNPFFVIEIAGLLRSGAVQAESVAATAVPATVRDVIGQRLGRLPPETQKALRAAAVLGREFGRLPLADVLGAPRLAVAAALQPAAAVSLISTGATGNYRFTHALVQAAVYEAIPLDERTHLHRRAVTAIAALAADDDERVSDLAFHSYHAALDGDAGPAQHYTRAAGLRARQRLAFGEAAHWLSLALELADLETSDAADQLSLLFEAADADGCAGLAVSARARFERAAELARRAGDGRAFTRAALGVGSTIVTAGRVDWDLVALLEEAIVVAADDADRARLESRLAIELYWSEGGEPSRRQSRAALQTADASGDEAALGVALHARQFTLRSPEHLDERIAIGERLVALAEAGRRSELAFQGKVWLAADVMRTGDLSRFRRLVESLTAMATRSRLPLQRWYATVMEAQLATVEGRVEKAFDLAEVAAALGHRLAVDVAAAYRLGQLCVLCRERDGLAGLVPEIEEVGSRLPYFVTVRGFAALAAATSGHPDAAAWEIDRLSGDEFAAVPRDSLWVATIALLTEAAAICASPHTRQLVELLGSHHGTFVVQGIPNCWGSVDRFLGRANITLGGWDTAADDLERAATMESRISAPLFLARTTLDRARLAVATGHRQEAERLVTQVGAVANRLGLGALAEEADRVVPPASDGSPLSRRERQVLALLSDGATNKGIAAGLVISLNTVERHLANIYTKLGVRGRAEAAAYAVRAGLATGTRNGGSP